MTWNVLISRSISQIPNRQTHIHRLFNIANSQKLMICVAQSWNSEVNPCDPLIRDSLIRDPLNTDAQIWLVLLILVPVLAFNVCLL